jgi:urease accessory protein
VARPVKTHHSGARRNAFQEFEITSPAAIDLPGSQPVQPRARGAVRLATKPRGGRSVVADLYQSGSLKTLFPRRDGDSLEAVLINTAGGITGGDRFEIAAEVTSGTEVTLTTQAAERAYRAQTGEQGVLRTDLKVASGARLNWLPQETILYNGSALSRRLDMALEPGAVALMVEPVVFGRLASAETLDTASFRDHVRITRDGLPIYTDRMAFDGDIAAHMARPAVGAGAAAMASVVYVAPDAEAHLSRCRSFLPATAGASLLARDMLVLRLLAADGFALRRSLVPVLESLSHGTLPRTWMI